MSRVLVLIPTEKEATVLLGRRPDGPEPRPATEWPGEPAVALTGFGVAAAGALVGTWLARVRPERCLLLGVAGTLSPGAAPVGALVTGDRVAVDGIGVGRGDEFLSAEEIGFEMLPGAGHDPLPLVPAVGSDLVKGEILSVATGAANEADRTNRTTRFPNALVEDMETWSVAAACRAANIPLTVVRGVSNVAGERDPERWDLTKVLGAMRDRLPGLLRER